MAAEEASASCSMEAAVVPAAKVAMEMTVALVVKVATAALVVKEVRGAKDAKAVLAARAVLMENYSMEVAVLRPGAGVANRFHRTLFHIRCRTHFGCRRKLRGNKCLEQFVSHTRYEISHS
jgi:hypothetical protein